MTTRQIRDFTIEAQATVGADGRSGRCRFSVFVPPRDAEGRLTLFAVLEYRASFNAGVGFDSEVTATALALARGSAWLRRHILELQAGTIHYVLLSRDGGQRHKVGELGANPGGDPWVGE